MNTDIKKWVLAQLEPRAQYTRFVPFVSMTKAVQISQAISLKRIADVLEKVPDLSSLHGDITNMAWEAGRSFQAGTRTDR